MQPLLNTPISESPSLLSRIPTRANSGTCLQPSSPTIFSIQPSELSYYKLECLSAVQNPALAPYFSQRKRQSSYNNLRDLRGPKYHVLHLVLFTLHFHFFRKNSPSSTLCNSGMPNAIQTSKQATLIDKMLLQIPSITAFGKDQFTYCY